MQSSKLSKKKKKKEKQGLTSLKQSSFFFFTLHIILPLKKKKKNDASKPSVPNRSLRTLRYNVPCFEWSNSRFSFFFFSYFDFLFPCGFNRLLTVRQKTLSQTYVLNSNNDNKVMLGTQCARCATAGIPCLDMPLREATRIARSIGCLGLSHASSGSAAIASGRGSDLPLLRPCTGPDAHHSAFSQDTSSSRAAMAPIREWRTLESLQRRLFFDAHAATDDTAVAVGVAAVNIAHMEGIVAAVQCGHAATHVASPDGQFTPGHRTVCVTTPVNTAYPTVLLWLRVESDAASSSSCLLAVRCQLSPEMVDTRWRFSQETQRQPTNTSNTADIAAAVASDVDDGSGDGEVDASANARTRPVEEEETLAAAKLRCVKAWATAALLHHRVIVSGQLRMEEVFDGDLGKVVSVPVIEIPQDSLLSGVTIIADN